MHKVQFDDEGILLDRPLALANVRVQVVVPSFAALLSDASWKALGDVGPVFGALGGHDLGEDLVFHLRPRTLRKVAAIVQLEPTSVALDLRFSN